MDSFYKFASENPWLTFFLALILCELVVGVARALASAFRKL